MQQVHLSHRWSHCKAEKVLRSAPRARSYNASKNSISANQRAAGNHNVVLALLNGLFMAISGVGGRVEGTLGGAAGRYDRNILTGRHSWGEVSHSGSDVSQDAPSLVITSPLSCLY